MRRIFSVALILVGMPLELYFYWYRFVNEGMLGVVAIVAGISLVLLLAIFTYFAKENKWWLLAMLCLASFDVLSTSAGQSFATMSKEVLNSGLQARTEDAKWQIDNATAQVELLDKEYSTLLLQEAGLNTIEDRAKWRTAVTSLETAKKRNRDSRTEELQRKEVALNSLSLASSEGKANIYTYYESLFGLSAKWVQFALHTILSVFLACMTPIGVLLWGSAESRAKPELSADTQKQNPKKAVTRRRAHKTTPEQGVRILESLGALAELPEICNPREIGKAMGTSHMPIYHAIKTGHLVAISMNPVRLRKEDVIEWASGRA